MGIRSRCVVVAVVVLTLVCWSSVVPAGAAPSARAAAAAAPPMDTLLLDQIGFGFARMSPQQEAQARQAGIGAADAKVPLFSAMVSDLVVHGFVNRAAGTAVVVFGMQLTDASLADGRDEQLQSVGTLFPVPEVVDAGGVEARTNGVTLQMVVFCRSVRCFWAETVGGGSAARELVKDIAVAADARARSFGIVPDAGATATTSTSVADGAGGAASPPASTSSRRGSGNSGLWIGAVAVLLVGLALTVTALVARRRRATGVPPVPPVWAGAGAPPGLSPYDPNRPQPSSVWAPPPPPPPPPAPPLGWSGDAGVQSEPVWPSPAPVAAGAASRPRGTPLAAGAIAAVAVAEDEWLGTTETAELLGVTPGVVRRMIASGALPSERDGRTYRVRRSDAVARRRS